MTDTLSLLPQVLDIDFPRGSSEVLRLTFQDQDLTGDTIEFVARDAYGADVIFRVQQTDHLDPTHGITLLPLDPAVIDDGKLSGLSVYVYTIARLHASGWTAWWQGKFMIHDTAILPSGVI